MSLLPVNFSLNDLRADLGGISNRLARQVTNRLYTEFENSVDGLFSRGLSASGIAGSTVDALSSRFGDSQVNGMADDFFRTSSTSLERVSPNQITENVFGSTSGAGAAGFGGTASEAAARLGVGAAAFSDSVQTQQFPSTLSDYFMSLKFKRYERPAPQSPAHFEFTQAIKLPLPDQLQEAFDLNISDTELGVFGGVADLLQRGVTDEAANASDLMTQSAAVGYSVVSGLLSGTLGEGATAILGQAVGAVPNPHLAAIFEGVNFRRHSFEWTFAPRNPSESETLQNILKTLKASSLPSYSVSGSAVLTYPLLVQIDLFPWSRTSNEFYQFKPAFIQNISIDYSPNGMPSFFAGTQLPTLIRLHLELTEVEIFTSNDYGVQHEDTFGQSVQFLRDSIGEENLAAFDESVNAAFRGTASVIPSFNANVEIPNPTDTPDANLPGLGSASGGLGGFASPGDAGILGAGAGSLTSSSITNTSIYPVGTTWSQTSNINGVNETREIRRTGDSFLLNVIQSDGTIIANNVQQTDAGALSEILDFNLELETE